jgi:CheY-like chemotaxis protein
MLAAAPDLRGRRVLIVDDNATNRHILNLQTQGWGMVPRDTSVPAEALAWLRQGEAFDVALIDHQMPDMDGPTLGSEIKRLRPQLPLLLVSSLGQREAGGKPECFAAFLLKPIRASQLYDALVGILAGEDRRARKEEGPARSEFDAEMGTRLPLSILLAEDNVVNQKLALRILQRLAYRADVAANGLEVLEAVARQPYDVVLMDVQMPEMDGLEATRQILRRWPSGRRPRIIAMTANVMKEDQDACAAAGMDDYVSKPIQVEALVNALRRCGPRA